VADDDVAISYKALQRGVEVVTSDGTALGTVDQVLDNLRENIFDGIVVTTQQGKRFVDAPEVARITERQVILTIDTEEGLALPDYKPGAPEFQANPRAGRLGRIFGGSWKRRR
jgi:sporulation protein YlmC with PRC-barrel domain